MQKDKYYVFLSSCYDKDMRENRELFRSEILARFNIISGSLGINTYLIDFEFGIPYGTKENQVLQICTSEVEKSDFFLCILGERYGHLVQVESLEQNIIETIRTFRPSILEIGSISILEIEILTALRYIPNYCVFFIQNNVTREEAMERLISEVIIHNKNVFFFTSDRDLADMAVTQFKYQLSHYKFNAFSQITQDEYRLFSRKLRYYVPVDAVQARISEYINNSDRRILILLGDRGCGKTTALAKWLMDYRTKDCVVKSWFHDLGSLSYEKVVDQLVDSEFKSHKNDSYVKDYALRDTFTKEYSEKHIFIIDGVNYICTIDDIEPWIIKLSSSVKVVITTNEINTELLNHPHVVIQNVTAIDSHAVIQQVMLLEGKQYEYSHLQDILKNHLANCSLNTIILALQQFFRVVKYTAQNANNFYEKIWTDNEIISYLSCMKNPLDVFCAQYQYIHDVVSFINYDEILPLILCSERGLSVKEMSQLVKNGEYIIYFFYFMTDTNEDYFFYPELIRTSLIKNMSPAKVSYAREKLLKFFGTKGDTRSKMEELYQLVSLNRKKDVISFLSSFSNFRIICPDSSLYSDGLHAIIKSKDWKFISHKWYQDFK